MRTRRSLSKAGYFGFAVLCFGALPSQIGVQDIESSASRPRVAERVRERLMTSAFGTIHAALFTFPRPAGSDMPSSREFRLASLDPYDPEITASIGARVSRDAFGDESAEVFPQVNRAAKGDRLVPRARPEPAMAPQQQPGAAQDSDKQGSSESDAPREGAGQGPRDGEGTFALASAPPVPADLPTALSSHASVPPAELSVPEPTTQRGAAPADDAERQTASLDDDGPDSEQIYFGIAPMGGMLGAMQPWAPGDMPVFEPPGMAETAKDSIPRVRPNGSASTPRGA
jgi:hypothetical protein